MEEEEGESAEGWGEGKEEKQKQQQPYVAPKSLKSLATGPFQKMFATSWWRWINHLFPNISKSISSGIELTQFISQSLSPFLSLLFAMIDTGKTVLLIKPIWSTRCTLCSHVNILNSYHDLRSCHHRVLSLLPT